MKFIYLPNSDLQLARELVNHLENGWEIMSAVGTRDGVQYILRKRYEYEKD